MQILNSALKYNCYIKHRKCEKAMKKTKYQQIDTDASMSCGTLYIFNKRGLMSEEKIENTSIIGRFFSESTADITIKSLIVSKQHGKIKKDEDTFIYEDINHSNGTFINGKKYGINAIDGRDEKVLNNGDVLRIDQSDLQKVHPQAVAMIFFAGSQEYNWHELSLEDKSLIEIGRSVSTKKGLVFEDDTVSRKHASLVKGLHYWQIIDHNSTNGVYINNERIRQPEILNPMDAIRIANTTFLFLGDKILYNSEEKVKEGLSICIEKRSAGHLFKRKVILENIELDIEAGELILIIGGSGAGKTTFLNSVMAYEKAKGKIYYDGLDLYKEYSKLKNEIGFVPQENLLRMDDEVFQTLLDAAEMKLDNYTREECIERVEDVLFALGLQTEKKSIVKKLSGGQKKRLQIAVELVSNPSLFFLDEPDSGLDGTNAISLMKNLRVIADDGKIVIVISHQPNRVAELFDKVVVIAKEIPERDEKREKAKKGGTLAFFGTVSDAYEFFECKTLEEITNRINPIDEGGDGKANDYIAKFRRGRGV